MRRKWGTIPLSDRRAESNDLLQLSDHELLELWTRNRDMEGTLGPRGWYRLLYADTVPGKRILDVGCGFGFDSLTFAELGAYVTLADIVPENVRLVERVAGLLGVEVETHYIESVASLTALRTDFDVVMAIGSLHNAPADVMGPSIKSSRAVYGSAAAGGSSPTHTAVGSGEGSLPFDEWATKVDGPGTPWEEWLDVDGLLDLLGPARFELVFYSEWHDSDFNWFDLVRVG